MGFWLTLAIFTVSFIAYALLAPKPNIQNAKPAELGDFKFPRSEEGTPVPLIWGRVKIRAPNTLWYGNLKSTPITERVKVSLFKKKTITTGYTYSLSIDLAWCLLTGSGITYKKLWFGEKVAWTGSVGTGSFSVSAGDLFGGLKNGGGVSGGVDSYNGDFAQTINSHLSGLVPDSTLLSAYRGTAHTVFKDFTIGETPNVRPISMEVEAIPTGLGLGGIGANGDANPAEVIYDILNSDWGRASVPSAEIESTTFVSSGSTLNTEGTGISIKAERTNTAKAVIEQILEQVDGVLYEDPLNQRMNFRLIREDYDINTIPAFDETSVVSMEEYSVSSWNETYNETRIVYVDRDNNYKEKTAFAQDMANINFQDRIKNAQYNFPGVKDSAQANKIANRELNFLSLPLAKVRFTADRSAAGIIPGDAIKLSWEDYLFSNLVLRVQKVDTGLLDQGIVTVYAIQDRFSVSQTIFTDPPASGFIPPDTSVTSLLIYDTFELPRLLTKKFIESGEAQGSDPENSYLQHLAVPPDTTVAEFEAQVSTDAGANYDLSLESAQFTSTALLNAAVAISTAEFISGTSTFVLKSVTDTGALTTTASESDVLEGNNLVLIGDEIIGFLTATDNGGGTWTLNNVYRGLMDTSPRAHAADDRVWFIAYEVGNIGTGPFAGTEATVNKYIATNSFANDESTAPTDSLTLVERPKIQVPPDGLTIDSTAHPTTVNNAVDTTVQLDWLRRDRLADPMESPVAADNTGAEAGTTYVVEWEVDAGSTNSVDMGDVNTYNLDLLSYGAITMRVYGRLNSANSLYPVTRTFTFAV